MDLIQILINSYSECHYLIKASIILCVLYAPYHFYFSRLKIFFANRIYLLSIVILTFIIPLLSIEIWPQYVKASAMANHDGTVPLQVKFLWLAFLKNTPIIIYVMGVIWMTIQFLIKIKHIIDILKTSEILHINDYKLILSPTLPVSSFFNYIME